MATQDRGTTTNDVVDLGPTPLVPPAPAEAKAGGIGAEAKAGGVDAAAPPVRTLAQQLLDGSATGVLALDERGVVREANTAAARLLPGLRVGQVAPPGSGLTGAGADVELVIDGRRVSARPAPLADGWTAWHLEDVTEQRARLDSLLAERARSRFLATASRRLGLSLHPGRTARTVVELAAGQVADRAIVVLAPRTGVVEWHATARSDRPENGRIAAADLPDPVAAALRGDTSGPATVLADSLADFAGTTAVETGTTAAVVTLPGNGVPAGALVLVRHRDTELELGAGVRADGSEVIESLVQEFAQRAGIALAAAALYAQQAATTATLRGALLQPELTDVPGLVLGGAYRPADEGLLIGGDFYDVYPDADPSSGRTAFLLGDVCGKGVAAAVSTGQVRQTLQALRRIEQDPVRLLQLLNETMLAAPVIGDNPRFASAVLGSAQVRTDGAVRLRLAGGGHLPPLVVRQDGSVESIEIDGMVLGVLPEPAVRARTIDLAPGEACVLYSDGVTEARGGSDGRSVFGEVRLARLLEGCAVMPAPAIAERVLAHALRWVAGGNHDDIAVLVVQAAPRPSGRHLHSVPGDGGEGTPA